MLKIGQVYEVKETIHFPLVATSCCNNLPLGFCLVVVEITKVFIQFRIVGQGYCDTDGDSYHDLHFMTRDYFEGCVRRGSIQLSNEI